VRPLHEIPLTQVQLVTHDALTWDIDFVKLNWRNVASCLNSQAWTAGANRLEEVRRFPLARTLMITSQRHSSSAELHG
jgi:hypothetical protein